jgi:hypothetical protein
MFETNALNTIAQLQVVIHRLDVMPPATTIGAGRSHQLAHPFHR